MDYKGQGVAENIYFYLNILFGIIGFIVGYIEEDFSYAGYGVGIAQLICLVVMIPDWWCYGRLEDLPWVPMEKDKEE